MTKHGKSNTGKNSAGNNSITERTKINPQNIDVANYFMTLTTEAVSADILSENEIIYMQSQIADILADKIWQYTRGESTSVSSETASDLIESIVFALDFFCISAVKSDGGNLANDRCVEMLREKAGIKYCYEKGLEHIAQAAYNAENLYSKLPETRLRTENTAYNVTINKSFALFFKNYDLRFFPHKSARFDYPLALSGEIYKYKGILYADEYLRYLILENEFCSLFETKDIQRLIKIYADNYGFTVNDLMENIFEKVFANILLSLSAGSNSLFIKREQYNKISDNFYNEAETGRLIHEYTQELIIKLKIVNPELQKYILKYQKIFAEFIVDAVRHEHLDTLIIYDDIFYQD